MITFLIVSLGYWGKGESYSEALQNLIKEGGRLKRGDKYGLFIFTDTEKGDIWVDNLGDYHYHWDKDRKNLKVYSGLETY
jgi:hypothetical protein